MLVLFLRKVLNWVEYASHGYPQGSNIRSHNTLSRMLPAALGPDSSIHGLFLRRGSPFSLAGDKRVDQKHHVGVYLYVCKGTLFQ